MRANPVAPGSARNQLVRPDAAIWPVAYTRRADRSRPNLTAAVAMVARTFPGPVIRPKRTILRPSDPGFLVLCFVFFTPPFRRRRRSVVPLTPGRQIDFRKRRYFALPARVPRARSNRRRPGPGLGSQCPIRVRYYYCLSRTAATLEPRRTAARTDWRYRSGNGFRGPYGYRATSDVFASVRFFARPTRSRSVTATAVY